MTLYAIEDGHPVNVDHLPPATIPYLLRAGVEFMGYQSYGSRGMSHRTTTDLLTKCPCWAGCWLARGLNWWPHGPRERTGPRRSRKPPERSSANGLMVRNWLELVLRKKRIKRKKGVEP